MGRGNDNKEKMEAKELESVGLVITITKEKNYYLAECKSLEEFGEGDTAVDALLDLAECMEEDYEMLLEHKDRLSDYLQNKLNQYEFKKGIEE